MGQSLKHHEDEGIDVKSHKPISSSLSMADHSSCLKGLWQNSVQHSPRLCHESYSAHRWTKTWKKWIRFSSSPALKYKHAEANLRRCIYKQMHTYHPCVSGELSTHFMVPSVSESVKPIHTLSLANEVMYLCVNINRDKCDSSHWLSDSHTISPASLQCW